MEWSLQSSKKLRISSSENVSTIRQSEFTWFLLTIILMYIPKKKALKENCIFQWNALVSWARGYQVVLSGFPSVFPKDQFTFLVHFAPSRTKTLFIKEKVYGDILAKMWLNTSFLLSLKSRSTLLDQQAWKIYLHETRMK